MMPWFLGDEDEDEDEDEDSMAIVVLVLDFFLLVHDYTNNTCLQ
jgi:hypothetical protein